MPDNKSVILVLQGRVRSTRLPAKGFFSFFDQTIWERMFDIARNCSFADNVIFATGDSDTEFLATAVADAAGIECFVGSETNVYERFRECAKKYPSDYIVRITCDNYLVQPEVLEGLLDLVCRQDSDYGYVDPLSHFAGEVIRANLFERFRYPSAEAQEHVTWDFRADDSVSKVVLPADYKGIDHTMRITLDNIDDFILMKRLEKHSFEFRDINCMPAIRKLNLGEFLNSGD